MELIARGESPGHGRYRVGIEDGQIQAGQCAAALEHALHIRDSGGIQLIQIGKRRQGSKSTKGICRVRICQDLSVSIAGNGQLSTVEVSHNAAILCRGGIPGLGLTAGRGVCIDEPDLCNSGFCCRTLIPGIPGSQNRLCPLRRNDDIRPRGVIIHNRHDKGLGVLIQLCGLRCAALAVLHRCAIIGIDLVRSVGKGDRLSVDRYHGLSTVIGSQRCAGQGAAFHGLDLHHVTAVIIGPVIIQNLGVACYDLGAKRVHRRVLNVTGFALALVVIGDIKRLAAKLDIRPRRMAKGNRRQLRAVSCEIRPYHHQALRQRQLRKALTVREHSIGLRYLGHIPPGDVNAPQRVTAAEHDAGILQARGIPVGHVDRLKALAVLEHVMGILEAGHIPVLNTLYFCQASALHEHIVGFFQFGSIPAGGVHGSKGMVRPAIVHEHTGRFFQRRRIPCGIRSGTILSRTGIGPQINARERVTAIEHVAHVRYFAHIPRRDTDICQRLIEIEHIRHRSGIPCIQQIRVGDALERRQIAERPGRILIGKDKAVAVPGNNQVLFIRAQERCNSAGHGRVRGIPGCLPCARHMIIREGDGFQRILIQLRCRAGTEPCILCV